MLVRSFVAAAALLVSISSVPALAATFPALQAEDLNGTKLSLPAGLPSGATLVLMGFRHKDQKDLDEWISRLNLQGSEIPWLEVSAIGPVPPFVSGIIRTAMKSRLHSASERSHMIPFFGDRAELLKLEAMPEEICLLVVSRDGKVLSSESGSFAEAKAASLMAALGEGAKKTSGLSERSGQ